MDWERGEVASRANCPRQFFCRVVLLRKYAASRTNIAGWVKFLLGWGWGGAGGLGALGTTGLVLPGTTQNPARLVYSAAAGGFPQGTAEPLRHASN